MIPDHLIDKAARAAYEANRVGKWARIEWEDLDRYTQDEYLTNAHAALEAVAADIWDDGYIAAEWNYEEVCRCAAWEPGECACGNYGNGHRIKRNPYKASED